MSNEAVARKGSGSPQLQDMLLVVNEVFSGEGAEVPGLVAVDGENLSADVHERYGTQEKCDNNFFSHW